MWLVVLWPLNGNVGCIYYFRKKQVAKFLIGSGADVSLEAKNGITAFDMASFIG